MWTELFFFLRARGAKYFVRDPFQGDSQKSLSKWSTRSRAFPSDICRRQYTHTHTHTQTARAHCCSPRYTTQRHKCGINKRWQDNFKCRCSSQSPIRSNVILNDKQSKIYLDSFPGFWSGIPQPCFVLELNTDHFCPWVPHKYKRGDKGPVTDFVWADPLLKEPYMTGEWWIIPCCPPNTLQAFMSLDSMIRVSHFLGGWDVWWWNCTFLH